MRKYKILLVVFALAAAGCSAGVQASYQPPFAPIKFSIDSSGEIAISTEAKIVTALGTFAVEGKGAAALAPDPMKPC
jgi:hypothetical protein